MMTLPNELTAPDPRPADADHLDITLEPGERWWGGVVSDAVRMPFGDAAFARDLAEPSNQAAPVLVSTAGRVVASTRPFRFEIDDRRLTVTGDGLRLFCGGATLRDAYRAAAREHFPASGLAPARELFTAPQYNTWIDQPYRPTQESVLRYAHDLLAAGMPAGVLLIDDSWAVDYGTWEFDRARFPDPAGMVADLNALGFSVMLWLVPFVSPDSGPFRLLEKRGLLVRDSAGDTAVRRWWNGLSAVLDLSNPAAVAWLTDQLDLLRDEVGIAGFKFDGGDVSDFRPGDRTLGEVEPVDMCEAWAQLGLRYPFNEFRACWRMGGQPLGQRLEDKPPTWDDAGLGSLIPGMLAQAMIGHAFTCPDMIGGGEIEAMTAAGGIDQEFFVRYAQLAALAPMMQFSVSPARVLDLTHRAAVHDALAMRDRFLPTILRLVDEAARTGEPIVRPMAYHAPRLTDVTDQFWLGPDIVVAPVLERGATSRAVVLPTGQWRQPSGEHWTGPAMIHVPCTLATLPVFERVD